MFFHILLDKSVLLHPRFFGPNIKSILIKKLNIEVEGTCSGRYGFIITVTSIEKIGLGKVQEGTGSVLFPIKFKAIVFKPYKGEILDAIVINVIKMGFFAEAGPLQIFVSQHLIPSDMKFDPQSSTACFLSEDGTKIEKDTQVRLKVVGTRIDSNGFFCTGSIKEDYLGVTS